MSWKSKCHSQLASGFLLKKFMVHIVEAFFSPAYDFVQNPSAPLNVGIPLAALSPAPVRIAIFLQSFKLLAASFASATLGLNLAS
jgi:hypothetical protein